MEDGILHEGLDDQRRDLHAFGFLRQIEIIFKTPHPHLLNFQIMRNELHLIGQGTSSRS